MAERFLRLLPESLSRFSLARFLARCAVRLHPEATSWKLHPEAERDAPRGYFLNQLPGASSWAGRLSTKTSRLSRLPDAPDVERSRAGLAPGFCETTASTTLLSKELQSLPRRAPRAGPCAG
eukprot:15477347-Alexandrium_andersonii.AAC.1